MFADVAVYNRTVMTATQLPMVIDKAINAAYEKRDPAVVIIPKDLGWQEIDEYISSTGLYREHTWERPAAADEVQAAADMLIEAKRPYIYFGQGAKGTANELRELSDLLQVPLGSTYLAKPIIEGDEQAWMGSTGRVATKPSVDGAYHADSVLFIGTNFEFPMFNPEARFIDVNLRRAVLGDRHPAYLGIVADAPTFLRQLLAEVKTRKEAGVDLSSAHQGWYDALVADRAE